MTSIHNRSHALLAKLSFLALALSCAALPGLEPFGPWEASFAAALGILFVVGLFCSPTSAPLRQSADRHLVSITIAYAIFFVLTGFLGLAVGNQLIDVIRSVAPYVGLIFVLAAWWWSRAWLTPKTLNTQLVIVGAGQAVFTFLVFGANTIALDSGSILSSRVTQFDARLTMPFTIAAAVVAFGRAAFAQALSLRQILYLGVALLCLAACLATQTRSQILSVMVGISVALIFGIFTGGMARFQIAPARKRRLVWLMIFSAIGAALLLIFTEFGAALLNALLLRNAAVGDGRIDYEVIPALELYVSSGPGVWLLGVGAGTPFVDSTLESRTYLHNVILYALLYGGLAGVFVVLALWWRLAVRVNTLWRQQGDPDWLALLSVIAAMFCYAQFFAVHKILPFNLILWLAVTCVLNAPARSFVRNVGERQPSTVRRGVVIAQPVRQSRAI